MYGKSTSNQRIESWWSQLRRSCADWWIRYFKDLQYRGLFCNEDIIQVECLKFCFMPVLQNELHEVAKLWNTHVIRPSHNEDSPSGRPDTLYFIPEATGTVNYLVNVENADIELVNELSCHEGDFPLVRRFTSPKVHYSEGSLVRRFTTPKEKFL
jgi:hypothetical protein